MPPTNDDFANATLCSGASGTVAGTTTGATVEAGEPYTGLGYGSDKTVWYKYSAPNPGRLTWETHPPSPDVGGIGDSVIFVYTQTGSGFAGLVFNGENDDKYTPAPEGSYSRLSMHTYPAWTDYYCQVDGYPPSVGDFIIEWTFVEFWIPDGSPPPPYDDIGSALALTAATGSVTLDTRGATMQTNEDTAGDGYPGVWMKIDATVTSFDLDLTAVGNDYGITPYIDIWTAAPGFNPASPDFTLLTFFDYYGNGDAAPGLSTITLPAGKVYYLSVLDYGYVTQGHIGITYGLTPFFPPPPNDNFYNGIRLGNSSGGCITGTTKGATAEYNEPQHVVGLAPNNSVWYKWSAPASGTYRFWIESIDPNMSDGILAAYNDGYLNQGLTNYARGDNELGTQPQMDIVIANDYNFPYGNYAIAVDCRDVVGGVFTLRWVRVTGNAAPGNDAFPGTTIASDAGSISGTTVGSTAECKEPAVYHYASYVNSDAGPYSSVWYSWTAPRDGVVHLWVSDIYDLPGYGSNSIGLDVWTGDSLTIIKQVDWQQNDYTDGSWTSYTAYSSEPSNLYPIYREVFAVTAGKTYRIRVSADIDYNGSINVESEASFTLNLTMAPPYTTANGAATCATATLIQPGVQILVDELGGFKLSEPEKLRMASERPYSETWNFAVWYKLNAPDGGEVTLNYFYEGYPYTKEPQGAAVHVYCGGSCAGGMKFVGMARKIGGPYGSYYLHFWASPGTTYYLMVGAYDDDYPHQIEIKYNICATVTHADIVASGANSGARIDMWPLMLGIPQSGCRINFRVTRNAGQYVNQWVQPFDPWFFPSYYPTVLGLMRLENGDNGEICSLYLDGSGLNNQLIWFGNDGNYNTNTGLGRFIAGGDRGQDSMFVEVHFSSSGLTFNGNTQQVSILIDGQEVLRKQTETSGYYGGTPRYIAFGTFSDRGIQPTDWQLTFSEITVSTDTRVGSPPINAGDAGIGFFEGWTQQTDFTAPILQSSYTDVPPLTASLPAGRAGYGIDCSIAPLYPRSPVLYRPRFTSIKIASRGARANGAAWFCFTSWPAGGRYPQDPYGYLIPGTSETMICWFGGGDIPNYFYGYENIFTGGGLSIDANGELYAHPDFFGQSTGGARGTGFGLGKLALNTWYYIETMWDISDPGGQNMRIVVNGTDLGKVYAGTDYTVLFQSLWFSRDYGTYNSVFHVGSYGMYDNNFRWLPIDSIGMFVAEIITGRVPDAFPLGGLEVAPAITLDGVGTHNIPDYPPPLEIVKNYERDKHIVFGGTQSVDPIIVTNRGFWEGRNAYSPYNMVAGIEVYTAGYDATWQNVVDTSGPPGLESEEALELIATTGRGSFLVNPTGIYWPTGSIAFVTAWVKGPPGTFVEIADQLGDGYVGYGFSEIPSDFSQAGLGEQNAMDGTWKFLSGWLTPHFSVNDSNMRFDLHAKGTGAIHFKHINVHMDVLTHPVYTYTSDAGASVTHLLTGEGATAALLADGSDATGILLDRLGSTKYVSVNAHDRVTIYGGVRAPEPDKYTEYWLEHTIQNISYAPKAVKAMVRTGGYRDLPSTRRYAAASRFAVTDGSTKRALGAPVSRDPAYAELMMPVPVDSRQGWSSARLNAMRLRMGYYDEWTMATETGMYTDPAVPTVIHAYYPYHGEPSMKGGFVTKVVFEAVRTAPLVPYRPPDGDKIHLDMRFKAAG